MLVPECLIQDREGCIEKGDGMARDEDKAVIESLVGMPDIPAHRSAEQQRDESMHFGAGSTRMTSGILEESKDLLRDSLRNPRPNISFGS